VSDLAFLAPGAAPAVSPLAHALAGATGIRDVSLRGKLEVRGEGAGRLEVGAEVIPITARRALVLCDLAERDELRRALEGLVVDVTAAYAGVEVEGATLLRRLTDLDLDRLPAAGKVAGAPALLTRDEDRFRIWFPRELGASVVERVRDVLEGLA
jgi:hypothetical protein